MSVETLAAPKKFTFSIGLQFLLLLFAAGGGYLFFSTLQSDPKRAWASFLLGYFFWLCIALAGVFFAALQYLAGAAWSVTVRRIPETFIAYLPVAAILAVILFYGLHTLYEWTHTEVVSKDPILSQKVGYLNTKFFIIRHIALFAGVLILGGWIIRNSLRQDRSGDVNLTRRNAKISAPFMLVFGWLFSFVSFDLLMSLAPHWFSTIFGIYCWSGLFTSGLAMIVLWVVALKKGGSLGHYVNENHLHDLGKLMFAFTVFWAYMALSQFLLIWYANLPEETSYYLQRIKGGWFTVSIALPLIKFVIPFFVLVARKPKRNETVLLFMGVWFLLAQGLDIYWMVYPTFYPEGPAFGWAEVGMFLGFGALFLLSVGKFLSRVSPIPIRDPRLEEALHHHQ